MHVRRAVYFFKAVPKVLQFYSYSRAIWICAVQNPCFSPCQCEMRQKLPSIAGVGQLQCTFGTLEAAPFIKIRSPLIFNLVFTSIFIAYKPTIMFNLLLYSQLDMAWQSICIIVDLVYLQRPIAMHPQAMKQCSN